MISESCAVSVIDLLETSASTPSPVGTASRVLIIADTDPRLGAALGRAARAGAAVLLREGLAIPPFSRQDLELTAALELVVGALGHGEIVLCDHQVAPAVDPAWWATAV